jgi:hypothetical protein
MDSELDEADASAVLEMEPVTGGQRDSERP